MYVEEKSDAGSTAFRRAEKTYQRHIETVFKIKKGKRTPSHFIQHPLELSSVVDVDAGPSTSTAYPIQLPNPNNHPLLHGPIYAFPAHPGFFLFRNALASTLQCQIIRDCFTVFPHPPAHTNFDRTHGISLAGIWNAAQQGMRLEKQALEQVVASISPSTSSSINNDRNDRYVPQTTSLVAKTITSDTLWIQSDTNTSDDPLSATHLLRKLRWASIGPIFDWTQRIYCRQGDCLDLPEYLEEIATVLAGSVWGKHGLLSATDDGTVVANYKPYRPDAALINYYYDGDTLNGHLDDAEIDLGQPLVSLSLGCPAVFLMGARSKELEPTAVLVRGGDVVLLAGEARNCYHGVPRIITSETILEGGAEVAIEPMDGGDDFEPYKRHMRDCRINMSIRATT